MPVDGSIGERCYIETMTGKSFVVAWMLLVALAGVSSAQQARVPSNATELKLSFAPLVKSVAPSVVNIYTKRTVRSRSISPLFDDPFFRRFFGGRFPFGERPSEKVQNSLGSGVIVRPEGLIVTNHHVIENADEITVVLADRREFEAEVVTRDERTDLAVLRIETNGETLPYLPLRDSDTLEVGDLVLAIGNPFGVGQTVTSGIVSALARTADGVTDFGFFIQTDAAINPGNSGGALVGIDGALAGINTAIYSRSGGSNGIGFAIPSNMVATVIGGALAGGEIVRPWLGARGQRIDHELARGLGLPRPTGVLVNSIHPESPAHRAGLRVGDVIVSVEGKEVADEHALGFRVAMLEIDGTAILDIVRDGARLTLEISLQQAPEIPPRNVTTITGDNPYSGAEIANLSPALAEELSMDMHATGVIVLRVKLGSPADRIGLEPGDILLRLNGGRIERVADLGELLERSGRGWRIEVGREGRLLRLFIQG